MGLIVALTVPAMAATTIKVKLNVNSTGGSYVGGYNFKLWNANDHTSYYFHSDSSGTGYKADSSYASEGVDTIESLTPGTYDMLADLTGKGNVFPSKITMQIQDSSGSTVWSKTFTAPGGVTNHPVSAEQNKGADNTITMDPSGNCRLNNVDLSENVLKKGSVLIITVTNSVSDEKKDTSGPYVEEVKLPAEMLGVASAWFDLIRFRIAPLIAGLTLAVCGFSVIAPTFFSFGRDAEKAYSKVAKTAVFTMLGLLMLVLLPVIVNLAKTTLEAFSWKP